MRIAYVINSMEGGGAQLVIPGVAALLRAHGAEVRVFALTRRDGRAIAPVVDGGLGLDVREGSDKDQVAATRWLARQLRMWKPSLIWTSLSRATLIGQLVGARLRVPVVSWQHNAWLRPTHLHLLRATRRMSALWVADSASVAEFSVNRLAVPKQQLLTWPLFKADPAAPRARPWSPGETIRIGSLGRLRPAKGYDVLIAALARLRQARPALPAPFSVEIVGDGTGRERLEAQAREAGVEIRFSGFRRDADGFLAGLHLYLQPSRREGLCIAVHEAMQAGLPVIAAETGEMPRSIGSGDGAGGMVVPPGDAIALTGALATMLENPEKLAGIGEAGRNRLLERLGPGAFDAAGAGVMARVRTIVAS